MKSNTILSKLNRRTASILLLSAVMVSGAFMMTACGSDDLTENTSTKSSNEGTSEDNSDTEPSDDEDSKYNQAEINSGTKIEVKMDPSRLDEAEKSVSLEGYGAKGALEDEDLSVADMLMYAIQDEHLARGEYQAIIGEFGNQTPYSNILRSENTHISYLEEIYESYGIDIPKDTSTEHLAIPKDLLEAAQIGVQAEIDNISMYEKFLAYDLPESTEEVFMALRDGSKSHLLAFEKQVDKLSN